MGKWSVRPNLDSRCPFLPSYDAPHLGPSLGPLKCMHNFFFLLCLHHHKSPSSSSSSTSLSPASSSPSLVSSFLLRHHPCQSFLFCFFQIAKQSDHSLPVFLSTAWVTTPKRGLPTPISQMETLTSKGNDVPKSSQNPANGEVVQIHTFFRSPP